MELLKPVYVLLRWVSHRYDCSISTITRLGEKYQQIGGMMNVNPTDVRHYLNKRSRAFHVCK